MTRGVSVLSRVVEKTPAGCASPTPVILAHAGTQLDAASTSSTRNATRIRKSGNGSRHLFYFPVIFPIQFAADNSPSSCEGRLFCCEFPCWVLRRVPGCWRRSLPSVPWAGPRAVLPERRVQNSQWWGNGIYGRVLFPNFPWCEGLGRLFWREPGFPGSWMCWGLI